MAKSFFGIGVALESIVSSLSYVNGHGIGWVAVLVGLLAATPAVSSWAVALAYGGAASESTLWHMRHSENLP